MTTYVYIIGDSETKLWGIRGRERLKRMLRGHGNIETIEDISAVPPQQSVLFLRADYVFDTRVLSALTQTHTEFFLDADAGETVVARVSGDKAVAVPEIFEGNKDSGDAFAGLPKYTLKDLDLGYQANLNKNDPAYVLPIDEDNRRLLESVLFSGSYKGVTDLVTKWLWPIPARSATHLCVANGLKPNHITCLSLVLAVTTAVAFWYGYLWTGLIMAWIMTFLDTVDGKLARVTVTSSRFGDVLDHGLDLVHPPVWYLAWGMGLSMSSMPVSDLALWMWVLFPAYVGGRLIEGAFMHWLAPFSMFIWRPFDSFNRLITARRNPNLILMTLGLLAGRPDMGFYAVVCWHVLSTALLAIRLVTAFRIRRSDGPLRSWLADVDPIRDRDHMAVRVFTRVPHENLLSG